MNSMNPKAFNCNLTKTWNIICSVSLWVKQRDTLFDSAYHNIQVISPRWLRVDPFVLLLIDDVSLRYEKPEAPPCQSVDPAEAFICFVFLFFSQWRMKCCPCDSRNPNGQLAHTVQDILTTSGPNRWWQSSKGKKIRETAWDRTPYWLLELWKYSVLPFIKPFFMKNTKALSSSHRRRSSHPSVWPQQFVPARQPDAQLQGTKIHPEVS